VGILGQSTRTASPKVLRKLAEEARLMNERKLRAKLSPLPGGEGGKRAAAPSPIAPATPPRTVENDDDLKLMMKAHNAGDHRFDGILKASGVL
jgi:hypothetical protein